MNDLQIDYFMAVATNLSFTKTSEELFVSQPAISKQIAMLEKELGAKLFKRNNQGTELTEVGRLYFDLFSRYKADLINTKMKADRITGKNKNEIRIGFLEGWDLFNIIPPMMKRYKEMYPESDVIINCCGVKELVSGILKDRIDLAVTMKNSIKMYSELEISDLASVGKVLLYSAEHPLAKNPPEELKLRDFAHDQFFAPWEIVDKMIIEAISSYTRPHGFVPNVRFVRNHESTITCVRNNMGVTIVDEWVWARNADDLRCLPFDAHDEVAVARLKSKGSENIIFMEKLIREIISRLDEG